MSGISLLIALCLGGPAQALAQTKLVRFPGSTAVGSAAPAQLVSVSITASGSIDSVAVVTEGSQQYDFSPATGAGTCVAGASVNAGQTCTILIGFTPKAPGDRRGAVVLLDRNKHTLGVTTLDGLATGPIGTFVPGVINTVAGNNYWIYNGDGGAATEASLFLPFGIAVNAAGDLFIVDSSNGRIRKVDATTGTISTIAGTGVVGGTGDGGSATAASLSSPTSIALDSAGDVYFSDNGNNAIRRIDAFTGLISTVAGVLGSHGYSGDGGFATSATLHNPNSICFDVSGNLYIADTGNNVVRMVSSGSGVISTVAGSGAAAYTGDGGAATAATLNQPWGVAVSPAGVMYIADQANNVIRAVSNTGTISTVAGNGTPAFSGDQGYANLAQLDAPSSVVVDVAGNLYVADSGNNRVRKVNAATGSIITIAGSKSEAATGDSQAADQAGLYGPYGLALDDQGSLYIGDVFHNRIRKVSANAATLVFRPMRVGRVASALPQVFENDGNAPLHVNSLDAVTNARVDSASTCTPATVLASLDQCVIEAQFAPTTIGTVVQGAIDANSDSANSPGVLTVEGQVLSVDPAAVTVNSSSNPSLTGSALVFTVTVTSAGTTPTGTVTILDGTAILSTVQLSSGSATYTTSALKAGSHAITASYSGDTNNASGSSRALTQIVQDAVADTTTSLSSNSNPVVAGASLKLTAAVAVSVAGAGSGTISGSVTFFDGTNSVGSSQVSNGIATLAVTSLSVGSHTLTAVYGGNNNYGASTSGGLAQKVVEASSLVSLSTGANPSSAGASLQLTAMATSNGGIPTGPVSFFDGTTNLGVATLNAAGIATLQSAGTVWTVGTHRLTASYAGDVMDSASVSAVVPQVVNLATTGVVLASSINPAGQGGMVTFSAQVNGNGGGPAGSVQFMDGSARLGSGIVDPNGVANFSINSLTVGTHPIVAVYGGDSYNAGSSSSVMNQVIQNTSTAVTLTSSANPGTYGIAVVLSAMVTGTGSIPSGGVTFLDNGSALGTSALNANGLATFTSSTLAIGAHTLTASYGGDSFHVATVSAPLSESIVQGTTTTLSASSTQSYAGTQVVWTAAVLGANGRSVAGSVALMDGSALLGNFTLNAAGMASFSSAMSPGTHTVTATFAGDTLNGASASSQVVSVVAIATTTTNLTSGLNPALSGAAVTFTASVMSNGGTPGGSVNLMDGATLLGTMPLAPSGTSSAVGSLTVTTLAPGVHSIAAQYTGDANDGGSTSSGLSEQIVQHTVVSLASSANPALLSDDVTITASVSNGLALAGASGTVTLTDGGAVIGTSMLSSSGSASFTLVAPALGTHSLALSYSGDASNAPATSTTLLQNVVMRPTTTTLTTSATSISAGQQVVLLSVVQGAGSRSPTGSVTFGAPGTVFGTAVMNAQGVATLTVKPGAATYNVTATYAGDTLFASSVSAHLGIVVGPTVEFTLDATPSTLTLQSGQHTTLQLAMTTAATFKDTISLGCAGLPQDATCTFSEGSVAVSGGLAKTLTVVLDTGNPLGAGATARMETRRSPGGIWCMLPLGAVLLLATRKKVRATRMVGLLAAMLALSSAAMLSGCGNSMTVNSTPAGSYTFQITGVGNSSGATQATAVQLTVTK